jgi:hypothetical protein
MRSDLSPVKTRNRVSRKAFPNRVPERGGEAESPSTPPEPEQTEELKENK